MRNFSEIERLVIKVGTNVLAPGGIPNYQRMDAIAADTAEIQKRELSPIIVSSGAIGFGARALALDSRPRKKKILKVCWPGLNPVNIGHRQSGECIYRKGVVKPDRWGYPHLKTKSCKERC